jgi:hypothetical protein
MEGKYSFFNMLKIYRDNRDEITAYFKGQPVEGFQNDTHNNDHHHDNHNKNDTFAAFGGIALFMVFLLIAAGIWIWALVVTVKYWKILPVWAQIISVIGLLPTGVGPIISLVVVYIGKANPVAIHSDFFSPDTYSPQGGW